MTRLDFALSPLSPAGIGILVAGLLLVALFGVRLRRLGLRGRTFPMLLGARLLSVGGLTLLLLGPSRVEERRVEVPLPGGPGTVSIPMADATRFDAWTPPPVLWTPRAPPAGERVRIREAAPPLLALYKNRDEVRVELTADLREPRAVELVLYDLSGEGGRRELRRRTVTLPAGDDPAMERLPFVPDRLGDLLLGVRLVCPPEVTCEDDAALVPVQVVRESLRILHVAGHPSWDLRFLREHLQGRPGYEVVSFYVLANQENFQPLPPDEVALIPFPTDELFLQELPGFDLLVIQDFPLGSYFLLRKEHLESIAAFVRGGGGLLVLGGGQAFGRGGMRGTPVADVLPVELGPPPPLQAEEVPAAAEFRPAMTRDGTAHPVTQLGGAGELPALAGWNHLGALRPGAHSLLTAPGGEPLLVLGDAGAGRVAVLGTDSMWTWAFAEANAPASGRAYEALLDHLVRWLTRDPAFDAVRIRAAGEESREGRPLAMRACIQSGAASSGQDLVWRARWTGLAAAAPLDVVGTVHTGDDGCGEVALPAASAGGWLVAVEGSPDGRTVQGEARIAVHPDRRSEEARRAARITAALPPPFLPLLPPPPLVRRVLPDTVPLTWEVSRPLWRHPLVLVLLAGLMALDWALRRRHGIL